MTAPIRALVVDDDIRARHRLRDLLQGTADVSIVGECADGEEAVAALAAGDTELVFLDVEMPRLDGLGVLAAVGAERMPPVIFTSAYSQYAIRAFDAYALDYLLKPFDDARFAVALARARDEVRTRRLAATFGQGVAALDPRVVALLEHLQRPDRAPYPEAIAIRTGEQYRVVRVEDIDWIEADRNYSRVYANERTLLMTKSLARLEQDVLDPAVFLRVHRSAIIQVRKVVAIEPDAGDLKVVLRDGTRVPCSRRHQKDLQDRLYFTS